MFRIDSILPPGHLGPITCCVVAAVGIAMVTGIGYGQQFGMFFVCSGHGSASGKINMVKSAQIV